METVLRSAICEITRLVEGSFLEEVGRGKKEADVLRRRVQLLETKLGEQERLRRVRCADCGRTGLSKKEMDSRDCRTKSGVELVCAMKQEGTPEGVRRNYGKGTITSNQDASSVITDNELKIVEVEGSKVEGAVKEEVSEATEMEIYSTPHCHKADHREPPSGNAGETSGLHTSQHDHRIPQRDKISGTKSCSPSNQDSLKQRTHSKGPDSKTEHPVRSSPSQPGPIEVVSCSEPRSVKQPASSSDSLAIKQEVVVVLPPEWEEVERVRSGTIHNPSRVNRAQEELQHGDPLPIRPAVEGTMVFPGPCGNVEDLSSDVTQQLRTPGKKHTKPVERDTGVLPSNPSMTNVARGQSIHKGPSLPKPSQALQHFQRAYADERAISALQSGRHLTQALSMRTHSHSGHHVVRAPHSCTQCGKGFSHLCHLRAHQQIHTGERQFCCSLCGRSFTKLSNLKAHRRVHTGERPYICMDCGKRFTQKCNLKRHQRIHSAHP
ncbi:uncharacterized protein LOC143476199 isoform X2 [Brachyhypopomus gauderio]